MTEACTVSRSSRSCQRGDQLQPPQPTGRSFTMFPHHPCPSYHILYILDYTIHTAGAGVSSSSNERRLFSPTKLPSSPPSPSIHHKSTSSDSANFRRHPLRRGSGRDEYISLSRLCDKEEAASPPQQPLSLQATVFFLMLDTIMHNSNSNNNIIIDDDNHHATTISDWILRRRVVVR